MEKRKIMFITGARADFGLMVPILREIKKSDKLSLKIYATSVHLMGEFGFTLKQIKAEFPDATAVKAHFESDDRLGMTKFLGKFLPKFINLLIQNKPDIALIPCDRIEALAAALACYYLGIPICHVHGGEKTFTVDESARHAITKLSHIHFAATKNAAKRIEKMGEEKWRIFTVGAPMLDTTLHEKLPDKKTLYKKLGLLENTEKIILVTQHAVSEEFDVADKQMEETLKAVKSFNFPVVVIYPPADAGGGRIIKVIERERNNPLFHIFPHIPLKEFLALQREASVWVGNSSAGIIESASFHLPVVNVGIRQLGREQSGNVINVLCEATEIKNAMEKSLYDKKYRKKISRMKNIWGESNAAPQVVQVLEKLEINQKLLTKQISY